jgi:ATP-dependent RNA helicase RhlE
MSFSDLGISSRLIKKLSEQGYTQPYPIQRETIPAILSGKDVLGISPTGSGKTAGYVLPILNELA